MKSPCCSQGGNGENIKWPARYIGSDLGLLRGASIVLKDCRLGKSPHPKMVVLRWNIIERDGRFSMVPWIPLEHRLAGPAKVVEPWLRTTRSWFAWGPGGGAGNLEKLHAGSRRWLKHGDSTRKNMVTSRVYIINDFCLVIEELLYLFLLSIQLE